MAPSNLPPDARVRRGGQAPIAPERLHALALELEVDLSGAQCASLIAYSALLRRWNRVHNLTAIERSEDLLTHHLLDCLAIVHPLQQALRRLGMAPAAGQRFSFLDAGSGAGLPGIPLALLHPNWHGNLVDAVQKKCAFLQQACVELQLRNVSVHHARLESCALAPQELIVSRALATLRDFVSLTRPLLAASGIWAAMKGRNPRDEIRDLPPGLEVLDTITLRVPFLEEQRHLVLLRAEPAPGAAPAGAVPFHR